MVLGGGEDGSPGRVAAKVGSDDDGCGVVSTVVLRREKGEGTGECEESRGGEVVLAVGVAAAVLD